MEFETFRRTLRGGGPISLKAPSRIKRKGSIMSIAKTEVVTMASTTPICEAIKLMAEKKFRRIPITDPGTKVLEGIVTATDIIDYLGGGKKFEIIQRKFHENIQIAINEPIKVIMTKNVVSVKTNAEISEAIKLMKENNIGGLPVVDEENKVRAIITERDISNLFADKISEIKVSHIMTKEVAVIPPEATVLRAEKVMVSRGFRRLPIVSGEDVIGIVTAMDIIRFFGSGEAFKHLQQGIKDVFNTPIIQIASKDVLTIDPEEDVGHAAKIMRDKKLGALPVVKEKKLIGMLTERDFFKIINV